MTPLAILSVLQGLDVAPQWEATKNVMITLGSTAAIGSFSLLVKLTLSVRDLKHEMVGMDGKNGLKSDVGELKRDVKKINARNIALDAIAEAERQLHPEADRRHDARRLRDKVHSAHDSDEHPIEG